MRVVTLVLSAASLLIFSTVWAQCPPVSANSVCNLVIVDNDACPAGIIPPTLVWCPAGDLSKFEIRVQAIGAAGNPCVGCPLRFVVQLDGYPLLTGANLFGCGANAAGVITATRNTDAGGFAQFEFWGGGCGCLRVTWSVDATACGGPPVLCNGFGEFCVKSPDLSGDGQVNFFDTFRYLPCLAAGAGYCCDFNCSGAVNFFDTFQYLPHLTGVHSCIGSVLPLNQCTITCP